MKRLTERNCNSGDYYMKCSKNCYNECAENIDCEDLYELIDRYGAIEEIIGDYSYIDRLRELVEADREGRCVVLPSRGYTDQDGKNALKSAMSTCFYHNNSVTRYIADAVAEKLTREAAEAALEGELNG